MYWTQKIAFAFRGNGFTFFMILPFSRNPKKPFPAAHSEGTKRGPPLSSPPLRAPGSQNSPRCRPPSSSPPLPRRAGGGALPPRPFLDRAAVQKRNFFIFLPPLAPPGGGKKSESALPEKEARFRMPGQPPIPGPRFRYRPADRWAAGSFCSRTR